MKFALMSDLHLEFRIGNIEVDFRVDTYPDADVLLLAGDILTLHDTQESEVINLFIQLKEKYKTVIAIAGNHEHYHSTISETKVWLKRFYDQFGIILLDNSKIIIDNITIIGSTLWSDTTLANKELLTRSIADYQVIKGETVDSLCKLHKESIKYIINNVVSNCVIMTHHAPSYKSVSSQFEGSPINPAFYTDLDHELRDISNILNNIKWIHGHMHNRSQYSIGNVDIFCEPMGYPQENYNQYFPLIFEV